jgi:predicted dehydrogenase
MVNIGILGLGFMGMTHYRGGKKLRGGKVTAICTRDSKKLNGDWRGLGGNFGDPGGIEDLSKIKTFSNVDDLLSDPDIDILDICLPSSMHKEMTLRALDAGKHVLLEKPIALNIRDADTMVRRAKKAGKSLMVAQVLPFFPEFAYVRKVVEEGTYGKMLGAHLKRIISMPNWSSEFSNMERSGGPGIDLHIHDTHYILLLCGLPDQVYSTGRLVNGKYVEYLSTTYKYKDRPDLAITCASGAISKSGRAFAHGFEVYLEKATILYEFSMLGGKPVLSQPLSVLTDDGKVKQPRLGSGDPVVAFTREMQAAVNEVGKGEVSRELSGEVAADALRLCFKEVASVQQGRAVNTR